MTRKLVREEVGKKLRGRKKREEVGENEYWMGLGKRKGDLMEWEIRLLTPQFWCIF